MSRKHKSKREQLRSEVNEYLMALQEGRGTDEDIERFRDSIKEIPALLNMFDMVKITREAVVKKLSGDNQALKLATLEIMKNTKAALGYDNSSQLERLLIEQIILCHIRLYWVEALFTQNSDQATMAQVQHWEKRLSVSQLRYFRAIETLARIRCLAQRTPALLQVNIGAQQVNQVKGDSPLTKG
ncbi:MAG: hypothetical protein JW953_08985 [Anaerolineae bacterium]|nr:hypothetical protein [Anaerolineae bacterium]